MMGFAYVLWVSLVGMVVLWGCDSGGGSGLFGTSPDDLAARDRAFAEEAVERVLGRALVQCTEVVCEGDGEASQIEDGNLGTITAACHYDCLPVEIDLDEQRHYQVRLLWRRLPSSCFERMAYEVFILAEVPVPCIPTL
jgi:hypothetical protein